MTFDPQTKDSWTSHPNIFWHRPHSAAISYFALQTSESKTYLLKVVVIFDKDHFSFYVFVCHRPHCATICYFALQASESKAYFLKVVVNFDKDHFPSNDFFCHQPHCVPYPALIGLKTHTMFVTFVCHLCLQTLVCLTWLLLIVKAANKGDKQRWHKKVTNRGDKHSTKTKVKLCKYF